MAEKEAKQRIEKLRELINHHRYLYHVLDRQEISEAALDSLKKELFDLEQKFPQFITLDSPTQRVGGKPLDRFDKVSHPQPMLSFNDAFSEEDIENWQERISKLLTKEEASRLDFFCELKIDGLAIELIYENEILGVGSTRGDGTIGEDVTQNLKTIEAIPLRLREEEEVIEDSKGLIPSVVDKLSTKNLKDKIVVRGEVFISKKEFEKANNEQIKAGLPPYANPRNLAAGSIRQLDPSITAKRRLDSYAYELITDFGQETHEQKHEILKVFGFKINPYNKYCKNLKEVFGFHKSCQKLREKISYEIDGIVVIVNSSKIFEKLGVVGKAPRGAIAYKFPLKQATTIVEDIRVQVGRTGVLTPVAYLKPVKVGGVTISRATLHNGDEIERLGLKIGDTVIVGRAGDVIPDVIKVLRELRGGKEKEFKMPSRCPVCGNKIVKKHGEVISRCINPECPAQKREYFYHFTAKSAFDIVGLGPRIIDRLLDQGLIQDPGDLFLLKEGDLVPLERFAEKSAKNLVQAIQNRKKITFPRFIFSLGIRNVGEETARDLAEYFGSLDKMKNAELQELEKIINIGPVVAKSIYDWFNEKRNVIFLEKIKKAGVKIIQEEKKERPLAGKTFIITGTLDSMTREEAKEKIEVLGGHISESVSKKITFVVAGKEPGSKYEKAKKTGVKIIGEKEFLGLINRSA